jgi:anti-anti-sigma factor
MTSVSPAHLAPVSGAPPEHPPVGMTFITEWLDAERVRITVTGDIDASNAAELPEYVFRRAANSRHVILDMSGVTFLATAGFSELCTIGERCTRASVEWILLPSPSMGRVLQICDPHGTLPVAAA